MAGSTKSYKSKTAGVGTGFPPWSRAVLAPVVLLLGKQEVFAKRAIAMLRREAMTLAESAGDFEPPEVTELDANAYEAGSLAQLLSPSLFGGKPWWWCLGWRAARRRCWTIWRRIWSL
ncbi:hypothetical protein [Mobiluncus mulieris]|uniref:hypothetical protein n=1 Tax=Mobiluncus mulieris TaxID=2052 RepID=UPI002092459E|nr:hypothetical protein [Mobiluncus mulieris]